VLTLHTDYVPYELITHKLHDSKGAYNMNCKVKFTTGEKWMVRFPTAGNIINADRKVEIEVATMNLIRQQTTMPVPEVKAWG
jgi:hypothetical protein